jgi:hypothetical protein
VVKQCVLKSTRQILALGGIPGHAVGFHSTACSTARSRSLPKISRGRAIPPDSQTGLATTHENSKPGGAK